MDLETEVCSIFDYNFTIVMLTTCISEHAVRAHVQRAQAPAERVGVRHLRARLQHLLRAAEAHQGKSWSHLVTSGHIWSHIVIAGNIR